MTMLPGRVSFFVDEDPSHWGHTHLGLPVVPPAQTHADDKIFVAFAPPLAVGIAERLKREDVGDFLLPRSRRSKHKEPLRTCLTGCTYKFYERSMHQNIVILGKGKLATALKCVLNDTVNVVTLTRADFDACQPDSVDKHLRTLHPTYVFNTVVWGGLDACAKDPHGALAVNTLFPLHVADLSRTLGFTLVHFSTDSVFADGDDGPRAESSPAQPPNMYGYTKFGADSLIPLHTQDYLVYRLPMMFGPSPMPSQFLERMVERLRLGEELTIAADIFSHAVYSLDVAQAIKAHLATQPASGLYHIAGEEKASLYDLAATTAALMGCSHRVKPASAEAFPGLDYKNRNIHLASEKLPCLRSWRIALVEYHARA